MKRNYSATSLKSQRIDKRFPKRVQTTIQQDLGNKYKITQITSPQVETSEQIIGKKPSGKWLTIYDRNGLYIRKSLVSGDVYVWKRMGKVTEYIGKLEQVDLWNLMIACGRHLQAFTEVLNRVVKGKRYVHYRLSLTKAPRDLFEN
jgi:hypothetical protein